MVRLDPRNVNLTIDQVREFMAGQCSVRFVKPGDTITWTCGYHDENYNRCNFQFQEEVTDYIEAPDWPDRLIEHIWREGHVIISNHRSGVMPLRAIPVEKPKWGLPTVAVGITIFNIGFFLGVVLGMR